MNILQPSHLRMGKIRCPEVLDRLQKRLRDGVKFRGAADSINAGQANEAIEETFRELTGSKNFMDGLAKWKTECPVDFSVPTSMPAMDQIMEIGERYEEIRAAIRGGK